MKNIPFLILGTLFGIILTKAQVISWYKIYEMFQFGSIHLYGVIGSAVMVGAISIAIIKKKNIKNTLGESIQIEDKKFHKGGIIGGTLFGMGWAMIGICPGTLYALIGHGFLIMAVVLLSVLAGTWTYSLLRDRLPH